MALTDSNGKVTDAYAYSPYGRLLHHEGENEQPFTFVGQFGVTQICDLYYMRARYYDPKTARFISRDPAWLEWGNALVLSRRLIDPESLTINDPK